MTEADPHGPIRFRIRFEAAPEHADDLFHLLCEEYLPALRSQPGLLAARLLVPYSAALSAEIGATPATGYELEFDFASETLRRRWVAQPIHDPLWGRAVALSTGQQWSGFFLHDDMPTTD